MGDLTYTHTDNNTDMRGIYVKDVRGKAILWSPKYNTIRSFYSSTIQRWHDFENRYLHSYPSESAIGGIFVTQLHAQLTF